MRKEIKLVHKRTNIKVTHKWVGVWALALFAAIIASLVLVAEHEAVIRAIGRDGFVLVLGLLGAFLILSAGLTGRMMGRMERLASDKRRYCSQEYYLRHHLDALGNGPAGEAPQSSQPRSSHHYHSYEYGEEDFKEWEHFQALRKERELADAQDAIERHNRRHCNGPRPAYPATPAESPSASVPEETFASISETIASALAETDPELSTGTETNLASE